MLGNSCYRMTAFLHSLIMRAVFLSVILSLLSFFPYKFEVLLASTPEGGDEFLIVDCLLPGQIRKLGRRTTFISPRRPIRTSALDCEIRGGEYVAYDRSNYKTALKVWLEEAEKGDAEAQTYVGEIYEKGLGTPPNYVLAAQWYKKAADKGYAPAQINLGHLYEKGLGVEKDPKRALDLYRKASGLSDAISLDPGGINTEMQQEFERLKEEANRSKQEAAFLRQQLEITQQELEETRNELERRRSEAETEQQILEESRRELRELERQKQLAKVTGDDTKVKKLEEQLKQREVELERQRHEVTQLSQEIAKLESEVGELNGKIDELNREDKENEMGTLLADPTIEVYEPPLTRGIARRVKAQPGIESVIVGKVIAPAGLQTFTVNGSEEKVDEGGLFRLKKLVQDSEVPVKLVAIDRQGKRATLEFLLAPETEGETSDSEIDFGQYYALIIGNDKYINDKWPDLQTAKNDANKVEKILREKYGFKTQVLYNATYNDILQAFNKYRNNLSERDNLLIYYAGHGQLDKDIPDRGYWVPVDGDYDYPINWISNLIIADYLSTMKAKHVLVVADSCYSGSLTRTALPRTDPDISKEALKNLLKDRSRTALTSGDLQPVLDAGGGEHSVFAKAFLDVLNKNTKILAGQHLHSLVYASVILNVEQVPQYAPIRFSSHISGDFLFVPRPNS